MTAPKTTLWDMPELTPIKHRILRSYLERTLPQLLSSHERIYLLDSFCGPGEYTHGEEGSPLIIINTLLACISDPQQLRKVRLLFLDEHKQRCYHLHSLLERRKQNQPEMASISYRIESGQFAHKLHNRLLAIEKSGQQLPPTFAFIDPFGYSDIPMASIAQLMQHPHCEVLITLSYEGSNRFLTHPKEAIHRHLTALFGTEQWRAIQIANAALAASFVQAICKEWRAIYCAKKNRQEQFCALYRAQLRTVGKATYVCMFRLKNRKNRTSYFLVFGTHQRESIERMKSIFWEIDPVCGYSYSVHKQEQHAGQSHLLPSEPDYGVLTRQLRTHLTGNTLTISELEEYILAETPFRTVGYKEHVLRPLEQSVRIHIISSNPSRRPGEYAKDDQIHFL
ncbi:MAG TPA: three-Cys-motif partner protein TcmP [Ktedonobacteraceae bacterium]|nr:three-Cys-motif partner protein TcmP [Ktedonobacteraceae bacterium]